MAETICTTGAGLGQIRILRLRSIKPNNDSVTTVAVHMQVKRFSPLCRSKLGA